MEKISGANALADFFCNEIENRSNLPFKNIIDTHSNLTSAVLSDIIFALGLDISIFETKFKFIDANLVHPRNNVAHGEAITLSMDEYFFLHDNVIGLIESFRNEIENASITKRYLRS